MAIDFHELRDELAAALKGIRGVLSVGLGKKDGQVVLVALVDSSFDTEQNERVPKSFRGIDVVLCNMGKAQLYSHEGERR